MSHAYTASRQAPLPSPVSTIIDTWRQRDLLQLLVAKELKIKYKGTFLGFMWSLLNPLLMTIVYAVVFSVIARFNMARYPVFLLSGLLPWTAFAASISAATLSVIVNGHLVRRVKFVREFLPLTSVAAATVNLLPSLLILLAFALVSRQPLGWPLLALPLLVLLQTLFASGIALFLAAATVYFRDLEHLVGVATTVWFFATPVIYPLSLFNGHRVGVLFEANPMTWLISSYQAIWHDNAWPATAHLAGFAGIAVLTWLLGAVIFKRLERRFAEEV